MGQSPSAARDDKVLDLVITNAIILTHGDCKGRYRYKRRKIAGIGSGKSESNERRVGGFNNRASTEVIAGEGLIVTREELIHIYILYAPAD